MIFILFCKYSCTHTFKWLAYSKLAIFFCKLGSSCMLTLPAWGVLASLYNNSRPVGFREACHKLSYVVSLQYNLQFFPASLEAYICMLTSQASIILRRCTRGMNLKQPMSTTSRLIVTSTRLFLETILSITYSHIIIGTMYDTLLAIIALTVHNFPITPFQARCCPKIYQA